MLDGDEVDGVGYRVSSYSQQGSCVAVAKLASGSYAIKHSRRDGPQIVFTDEEWKAFVSGVKAAEFDF